jgi:hypothetical protein
MVRPIVKNMAQKVGASASDRLLLGKEIVLYNVNILERKVSFNSFGKVF